MSARTRQAPSMTDGESGASLIYDGECPFCAAYVRYIRVRESVGGLALINARDGGAQVEEARKLGFDLDEGMLLKLGGQHYHGADCINALALLSSGSSAFNRVNAAIFRSPLLSRALYPALRLGRNTALRALGRRKLSAP